MELLAPAVRGGAGQRDVVHRQRLAHLDRQARLLVHLAHGCLDGALAGLDEPLRQHPVTRRAALRLDGRNHEAVLGMSHDDAAGGVLPHPCSLP